MENTTQTAPQPSADDTAAWLRLVKRSLRGMMNGPVSASMREKGLAYKVIFGVELPRLQRFAEELPHTYALAAALWREDIRECRLLAGLVQPVESFLPDIADIWVESMRYPEEAQYTVMSLFCRLPYASDKAFAWIADERPMFQLCGFLILSRLFMKGNALMKQSENEYLDQAQAALRHPNPHIRKAAYDSLLKYSQTGDEPEALVDKILTAFEKG